MTPNSEKGMTPRYEFCEEQDFYQCTAGLYEVCDFMEAREKLYKKALAERDAALEVAWAYLHEIGVDRKQPIAEKHERAQVQEDVEREILEAQRV